MIQVWQVNMSYLGLSIFLLIFFNIIHNTELIKSLTLFLFFMGLLWPELQVLRVNQIDLEFFFIIFN